MFSPRRLQTPLFLSRPSPGVLELSDLSKMFTSPALPLVSFSSSLPNKSWQRCVGLTVTPPFQLSDTCAFKKDLPPGIKLYGGGGGAEHFSDQGSPINHFMGLWGERNKGKGNALYYVSLSFITTVLPQHGIPLPCGQRMVKILRCVTHGVARLVGVPVGRMSDS